MFQLGKVQKSLGKVKAPFEKGERGRTFERSVKRALERVTIPWPGTKWC